MATSESADLEAVKVQLEAILEEQGKQIYELQQRMNQDTSHSKSLESQLAMEREMWTRKEKTFSSKVKQLEKELTDLRNIIQHEDHPEKVLLSKLSKDVAQKEQLITGLKTNLGKERSRSKELERQVMQLQQQQLQQNKRGLAPTEQGKRKTKRESSKEDTAEQDKIEKQDKRTSTSSGEIAKLEVLSVETAEDDEQLEAFSLLFSSQTDSVEGPGSSPYSKENLRVGYPECSHCHKILVDNVILPCGHRYCIQCVQVFMLQDLKNEDDFSWCRICEKRFEMEFQNCLKIPLQLKRSVRKLAMTTKGPCEHCMKQRERNSEFYCIQCECCVCSVCSSEHIEHSSSGALHLLLAIRIPIYHSELLDPDFCDEHPDKPLSFYCDSCRQMICIKCLAGHNDHSRLGVEDCSTAVKDKMKVILSDMNDDILYLTRMSSGFKRLQKDHHKKICRIRESIAENVDIMKYWLHKQAETLNKELDFIERLSDDGVSSTRNDFEGCLSELQQFRLYAEEFIDGVIPSHLACFGEDVLEKARDLIKVASEKKRFLENLGVCKGEHALHPVNVFFAPNRPETQIYGRNLVGELKTNTVKGWSAMQLNLTRIHTIKPSLASNEVKDFAGLTTLGDELFVATGGNSSIEVYDMTTFETKHLLSGFTPTNISDIVSCSTKHCLYVYCCVNELKGILKTDSGGGFDAKKMWVMEYDAGRLSVTDECNIVVTGCNTNRLSEYTSDGKLCLELQLEPETGVLHLWHALKTGTGHFVVSHGIVSDAVQGVCLVDQAGTVLRSYRGQLDIPMYLAFGERGGILVADLNNKRVLQLNAFLESDEKLVSKEEGLLWPCRIHFDLATERLFVANSTFLENWELLVFDTK